MRVLALARPEPARVALSELESELCQHTAALLSAAAQGDEATYLPGGAGGGGGGAVESEDETEVIRCSACALGVDDHRLLLCDNFDVCRQACHTYCLEPPLAAVPEGDWYCPGCIAPGQNQFPSGTAAAAPAATAAAAAVAPASSSSSNNNNGAALVEWKEERVDRKLGEAAFAHGWRVTEAWPGGAAKFNWKYSWLPTGAAFTSVRQALAFQSKRA